MDEHLLERVSVLEEIVKRSAETLKMLLDALNRQEKNGFVAQTGLLALKDLLERKGLLVEEELLDLWETRVDHHMTVMEKRERFLERKERMLGGFSGDRRERFKGSSPTPSSRSTRSTRTRRSRCSRRPTGWTKGTPISRSSSARRISTRARPIAPPRCCGRSSRRSRSTSTRSCTRASSRTRPAAPTARSRSSRRRSRSSPDAFLPHFTLGALFALQGPARAGGDVPEEGRHVRRKRAGVLAPRHDRVRARPAHRGDRGVPEGRAPGSRRRGRPLPARPLLSRPRMDAEGGRAVPVGARAESRTASSTRRRRSSSRPRARGRCRR